MQPVACQQGVWSSLLAEGDGTEPRGETYAALMSQCQVLRMSAQPGVVAQLRSWPAHLDGGSSGAGSAIALYSDWKGGRYSVGGN